MKKIASIILLAIFSVLILPLTNSSNNYIARAVDIDADYYTVYDTENAEYVVFMTGSKIEEGDEYISADNKHYIVESVDQSTKTGKAKFKENVKMPVYNIKKKDQNALEVNAESRKSIGIYHTHNDECYNDADGTDSIYGKGGIHDVGATFVKSFQNLGMTVYYDESLHLPHDSGAYGRSMATANTLLKNDLDALFDVHRDATPRSEYITTVNGKEMSKVRMVIGSANINYAVNKDFALNIKAYADEVYPGLIKDIYIGRGNYNQQLFDKAMLFEFGTNTIEKQLVLNSCDPLAKTVDVVLFGTQSASAESVSEVDTSESTGDTLETGLINNQTAATSPASNTLWIVLSIVGAVVITITLLLVFSKNIRYKVGRFFSELFAGIFGKKKARTKNDTI